MGRTCPSHCWHPHETAAGAPIAAVRLKNEQLVQALDLARRSGPVRDIVIPPCPELLVQLQDATATGDPDPETIARIASADVAMAAALLRQANSPLYGLQQPVSTVGQALNVLGMKPAVKLLSGFLTRHALQVHSPLLAHFWETSTRRAYAMGYIARQMYGVNADIAHTCGLFCNVGIPVMLQGIKGYEATLSHALAQTEKTVTEVENEAHRTDHAVVGAIVAKTWRLSPDVAHAVRLHHDFTVLKDHNIPAKVRTLVAMALLAEHLVALHEGVQQHREWDLHGAECLAHLHVSEEEIEHWQDALHEQFTGPAGF